MTWTKKALIAAWSLAAIAWVAVIPVALIASNQKTIVLSLGGAAVVTELAIYATAGLLGLTLVESRKRLWNTLKGIVTQTKPDTSKLP